MKNLFKQSIEKSYSYQEYRNLVTKLHAQNKTTTKNSPQEWLAYSTLNEKRMERLDKKIEVTATTKQTLSKIETKQTWVVISESWCGDAAQNLPVINKIAMQQPNINLRIVLREQNPELMSAFLTNGGKAIPKLIALNESNNVLFTWGPRPSKATQMVVDYKEKHGKVDDQCKKDLQVWYNKDKGENLQQDILSLI